MELTGELCGLLAWCNTQLSPGQGFCSLFPEDVKHRVGFLLKHHLLGGVARSFASQQSQFTRS